MSWKIEFLYKTIWGNEKRHIYNYWDKKNISNVVFDGTFEEAKNWIDNEICSMVDDCKELLEWEVYEE